MEQQTNGRNAGIRSINEDIVNASHVNFITAISITRLHDLQFQTVSTGLLALSIEISGGVRMVVISSYAIWSRRVTAFRLVGGDDEQENAIDEVEVKKSPRRKESANTSPIWPATSLE